ncbi:MAG: uracil-DNA glycosylase [Bacilli bacterium]|nr:uracil-DNA glycosylase [Bacilli bacterium]
MVKIGNDWDLLLKEEFNNEYYLELRKFLVDEYNHYAVYPDMHDIFNALRYTPYQDANVVLLGQDPYHGKGQAHGLCFSVQKGVNPPPSLKNIYKELNADLGCPIPNHGELSKWAKQGVLMLNTCLTVREGQPNSHAGKGWEILTDKIISLMNAKETPVVFLLWGKNAQSKESLITNAHHLVLKCAHPSPFSAYNGFFGCKHFSKTNEFLLANNQKVIDWQIE